MNIVNYKRNTAYKGGYSSYLDGTFHKYQGLDKCLDEIRDTVEGVFAFAEQLQQENEELKDLHWENQEIHKLQEQLENEKTKYEYGFPISEACHKKIMDWQDQHWTNQHNAPDLDTRLRKQGAIGGSFTYEFIPTSIGTVGTIVCPACREKARRNCGDNRERYRELLKEYDAEFEFQGL